MRGGGRAEASRGRLSDGARGALPAHIPAHRSGPPTARLALRGHAATATARHSCHPTHVSLLLNLDYLWYE